MTQTIKRRRPRRKTPLPPKCPVHDVPMLVRHASKEHQYRYCPVEGCQESLKCDRAYRLKNAMSLWVRGIVNESGKVILCPGFGRTMKRQKLALK